MPRSPRPSPVPAPALHARADRHGAVVEDPATGECLRLTPEGRWTLWSRPRGALRRALTGEVRAGTRRSVALDPAAAALVHEAVRRAAARFARRVEDEPALALVGDRRRLHDLLRRAAARGAPEGLADLRAAHALYPEGVPILPPHRARDLVVVPARGCPNAGCSFCAFYRGRPFRPLSAAAFREHLAAVVALHGEGLAARDGVFLGSASAASLADARLLERLGEVRAAFGPRRRGVAAFLDPDHAPPRTAQGWARLRDAGLLDLTLGLETGEPALRREVGKSADLERFAATVAALRAAGLRVALTLLLGLGGEERAAAHREASTRVVASLGLGPRDLVYLSTLEGSLPAAELAREQTLWSRALHGVTAARLSLYPAASFVAWA